MVEIVVKGTSALQRWAADFRAASEEVRGQMASALNVAGDAIRKTTIKVEAKRTGLPVRTLTRAQKIGERPSAQQLVYRIDAEGGEVALKYFHPVESGDGVVAKPWGVAREYQGGFIKGGRAGARVEIEKLHGQVFMREGHSRLPIKKMKSDVNIATELVRGPTLEAFEQGVAHAAPVVIELLQKNFAG